MLFIILPTNKFLRFMYILYCQGGQLTALWLCVSIVYMPSVTAAIFSDKLLHVLLFRHFIRLLITDVPYFQNAKQPRLMYLRAPQNGYLHGVVFVATTTERL